MNLTEFKKYLESATTNKNLNELDSHEWLEIKSKDGFVMTLNDVYTESTVITDEPQCKEYKTEIEVGEDCYLDTRFDEEIEVTIEMLDIVEKWLNERV